MDDTYTQMLENFLFVRMYILVKNLLRGTLHMFTCACGLFLADVKSEAMTIY